MGLLWKFKRHIPFLLLGSDALRLMGRCSLYLKQVTECFCCGRPCQCIRDIPKWVHWRQVISGVMKMIRYDYIGSISNMISQENALVLLWWWEKVESLDMTFQFVLSFGKTNKILNECWPIRKRYPPQVESIIQGDKFRDSSALNSLFDFQRCPCLSPVVIWTKTSKRWRNSSSRQDKTRDIRHESEAISI